MSLILEALRKSEAERQAAQLPGLISPGQGAAPRRRSRLRWLVLPAVLIAGLALGWMATRWLQSDPSTLPPSASPVPPGAQTPPASPSTPAEPAASSERARQLAERATPSLPATAPETAGQGAPQAAPPIPSLPTPLPPPEASQPVAATPAVAAVPDAARLALMSTAQRERLPPLKLTVHVYNDDPERRFAIVDGRRVVEGDSLGAGVSVRAIRRDGLLLQIDEQPWLLERAR